MSQKPSRHTVTTGLTLLLPVLGIVSIAIILYRLSDNTGTTVVAVGPSIVIPLLAVVSLLAVVGPVILTIVDKQERLLLIAAGIFAMAGLANAALTSSLLGGTTHFPFSVAGIVVGLLLCFNRLLLAAERGRFRPATN
ncbi:hypothetical protein M2390_001742 [Mycetocola sp. BIGb0189]|uniref:hypothetical protein n=1 Tax=Mycetocola sp. BIGb0189 TaxID=2940604 RepID=UPI00216764A0|nr:hypothetical protein [Mycetocola sp. BIGb0189]MCS4276560.1 hypothetical protein [Mycetocola sp. BIGb0189]